MDNLAIYIEALIFASDQAITRKEIKYALENSFDTRIPAKDIESALAHLQERYHSDDFGIDIAEMSGGFQFLTKPAHHHVIGTYLKLITKKRLSRVALETLAIVAYKQPVAKSELEKIRGVNCDYALSKLLEKELVEITGRGDGPGRPLMYGTSEKFMDYLRLYDLSDLPQLKDFKEPDERIGEPAPIEEPPETSAMLDELSTHEMTVEQNTEAHVDE